MIIELWVTFIALSIALIALGHYIQTDVIKILGFLFIFLLGFAFLNDGLDYKTGDTVVTSGGTSTITYNYATYTNATMSIFTIIIAVMGWILIFVQNKSDSIQED
jgi:hypothetical protein